MSQRITRDMLERRVEFLNNLTGNPPTPWTRDESGNFRSNIGNFHIHKAPVGYRLHQMSGEHGGVHDVFRDAYTARELLNCIAAYEQGILDTQERKS